MMKSCTLPFRTRPRTVAGRSGRLTATSQPGRQRCSAGLVLLLMMISLFASLAFKDVTVLAANTQSTSYTRARSINGRIDITQDAYLPSAAFLDLGLLAPADLFFLNDRLYIADKGNARVLVINLTDNTALSVGEDVLKTPTGVSADPEGRIYVADPGSGLAYRFQPDGDLDFTFARPTTPNFGRNQGYKPTKLAAADQGGVYMVSEGTTAGIIHIDGLGNFLGYFTSNDVNLAFFEKLKELVLTEEQQSLLLQIRTPPSFGNIYRGGDGLVYTINRGSDVVVKKHAISGLDMFKNSANRYQITEPTDLCVAPDGRFYALQSDGTVVEFTSDGDLIVAFGGSSYKTDKAGRFEVPSGIAADHEGRIYVLDEQRAFVQVFTPTPVQQQVHQALTAYNNGEYATSKMLWQQILKFNNTSYLAHLYMGKSYLQEMDYQAAQNHFAIARVRDLYSTAYWEVRNIWLQVWLGRLIIGTATLFLLLLVFKRINKRRSLLAVPKLAWTNMKQNRLIADFAALPQAMKHPIDTAYNVKVGSTGTWLSASVIFLVLMVLLVLDQVASGFIFSVDLERYSLFNTVIYYIIAVFLFVIGNYFISSINDGKGTLRSIYISLAYAFAPAILLMPMITLISNVSTLNEAFLLNFARMTVLVLCLVNMVLVLIEIHDYSLKLTLGNILVTLFFMAVAILAASVAFLLLRQVFIFVQEMITEVMLRARAS